MRALIRLLGFTLALAPFASAGDVTLQRLGDRVVVASSEPWATNMVGIKTDQGIVVVDTHLAPSIAERCRAAIVEALGTEELAYVVNTHFHLDHAGGNRAFADTTIVGQDGTRPLQDPKELVAWAEQALEQARKQLEESGPESEKGLLAARAVEEWEEVLADYRRPDLVLPPSLTFSERLTLSLGTTSLRLIHFGTAHSDSDTIVHVPEESLLVVGALLGEGQLPGGYMSEDWDVPSWLEALDAVLAHDEPPQHVVAGHGPVLNGQDLLQARDYFQRLWTAVTEQVEQGASLEQAQTALALEKGFSDLGQLRQKNWAGHEIHPRNVERFWRCARARQGD